MKHEDYIMPEDTQPTYFNLFWRNRQYYYAWQCTQPKYRAAPWPACRKLEMLVVDEDEP